MRMNVRPGTLAAAVCIVVLGFGIGAWLAIRTRGPVQQAQRVTVTNTSVVVTPTRTLAPRPAATAAPTAKPVPTESAASTVAPVARATAPVAGPAVQGSWQLDEANVQVGAIRWIGNAETVGGNTLVFTVHKQSVGGRAAMPCEQQTVLHAAFSLGVAQQTVPYREVNCAGVVSTGEVHVTSLIGDDATFSGSFSQGRVNLGTFTARKL